MLDGHRAVNARLAIGVYKAQKDKYVFIELAAYGELGDALLEAAKDEMVSVWGHLQHRKTVDGSEWFQRIEVTRLERLHSGRAVI